MYAFETDRQLFTISTGGKVAKVSLFDQISKRGQRMVIFASLRLGKIEKSREDRVSVCKTYLP